MGCKPSAGRHNVSSGNCQTDCQSPSNIFTSQTLAYGDIAMNTMHQKLGIWSRRPLITRKPSCDSKVRLGEMIIRYQTPNVLLWSMAQLDSRCKLLCRACQRMQIACTVATSKEEVLKTASSTHYSLIIVDQRASKHLNNNAPILQLKALNTCKHSVFVALVNKSFISKEGAAYSLLQKGFNRWLIETASETQCVNEVQLLLYNDVSVARQARCSETLFTALNESRDIVEITDTDFNIVYVNRTCVEVLGSGADELQEQHLLKLHQLDSSRPEQANNITTQLSSGRQYDGHFMCRRHSGDTLLLPCRAVPVCSDGVSVDHYVFIKECASFMLDKNPAMTRVMARASVRSLRKPSFELRQNSNLLGAEALLGLPSVRDSGAVEVTAGAGACADGGGDGGGDCVVTMRTRCASVGVLGKWQNHKHSASQIVRRPSLARAASTNIETPITRVINIILNVQDVTSLQASQELEKAVDILRSTELYSPACVTSSGRDPVNYKPQDPVASDLLGALLSHGPSTTTDGESGCARHRSDYRSQRGARSSLPSTLVSSGSISGANPSLTNAATSAVHFSISQMLRQATAWSFDIFALERITEKRPLVWLGMHLFEQFNVHKALKIDVSTMENWLNLIEANYHNDNSYHNSTHAADVLQCTAHFLQRTRLESLLDQVDMAVCLIAAVVHDVDHPGKNSQYMCNTRSDLALLYNDISVLESHHSACTFRLTLSDCRVNILKNLDDELYRRVRQGIVDMVLATEMNKHFEHLSKFLNAFSGPSSFTGVDSASAKCEDLDLEMLRTTDNLLLIKRMLIKCADVSNPLRVREQSVEWAHRIAEEYFVQTEHEKQMKLPVVMPMFDRATCSIPRSQIGFIDFFINDMFEAWDSLIDIADLIDQLEDNYQFWSEMDIQSGTARSRCSSMTATSAVASHLEATVEESSSQSGSEAHLTIASTPADNNTDKSGVASSAV